MMFYLILLKAIFIKQEKYHIFFSTYKYIRSEKNMILYLIIFLLKVDNYKKVVLPLVYILM